MFIQILTGAALGTIMGVGLIPFLEETRFLQSKRRKRKEQLRHLVKLQFDMTNIQKEIDEFSKRTAAAVHELLEKEERE